MPLVNIIHPRGALTRYPDQAQGTQFTEIYLTTLQCLPAATRPNQRKRFRIHLNHPEGKSQILQLMAVRVRQRGVGGCQEASVGLLRLGRTVKRRRHI